MLYVGINRRFKLFQSRFIFFFGFRCKLPNLEQRKIQVYLGFILTDNMHIKRCYDQTEPVYILSIFRNLEVRFPLCLIGTF